MTIDDWMTSERRVIWKPLSPLSRRVLGSTVVITFCTVAAAAAQQTPDLPVFRTSTAAVTVDVIVRDSKGYPVLALTRDDFEVLEDGAPQRLISFEAVAPGPAVTRPGDQPALIGKSAGAPAQSIVAIVFHRLPHQSRVMAADAVRSMVSALPQHEYAGLFVMDLTLRPLSPFTRNVRHLEGARRWRPRADRFRRPRLQHTEAGPDRLALDLSGGPRVCSDVSRGRRAPEICERRLDSHPTARWFAGRRRAESAVCPRSRRARDQASRARGAGAARASMSLPDGTRRRAKRKPATVGSPEPRVQRPESSAQSPEPRVRSPEPLPKPLLHAMASSG